MLALCVLLLFFGVTSADICNRTFVAADWGEKLELYCTCLFDGNYNGNYVTKWYKGSSPLRLGPNIILNGNMMKIKTFGVSDVGEYYCSFTNGLSDQKIAESVFNVYLKPYVTIPRSLNNTGFTEGFRLDIYCNVVGDPMPDVEWFLGDKPVNTSDERIKTTLRNSVPNSKLVIDPSELKDEGAYRCRAKNEYGSSEAVIAVRVRDKTKALWPFLGLCLEVVILMSVIFLYECYDKKRRMDYFDDLPPSRSSSSNSLSQDNFTMAET